MKGMRTLLCLSSLFLPLLLTKGYDLGGDLKYLQTTWSLPEPLKMARVLDLYSVHKEVAPPAALLL